MPISPKVGNLRPRDFATAAQMSVSDIFTIARCADDNYLPTRTERTTSGKVRALDVPKRDFKKILRRIHKFIQRQMLASSQAHGGVSGRSSFTSASKHLGKKVVEIRDVSDCYPSISSERLKAKLQEIGFRADTAHLLTGLLTCRGRIPQGSPTSGDALNLYLWDLDECMASACGQDVEFTRMADDHVVSGNDTTRVQQVAALLEDQLAAHGLKVNEKKKLDHGKSVAPRRQCVHSIGVNHPTKTRIPRPRTNEYLEFGIKYVRAARCVSASSLRAVAKMRWKLCGYANYSNQADLSPCQHLKRLIKTGDSLVERNLRRNGITYSKKWWVATRNEDRPAMYSNIWRSQGAIRATN